MARSAHCVLPRPTGGEKKGMTPRVVFIRLVGATLSNEDATAGHTTLVGLLPNT